MRQKEAVWDDKRKGHWMEFSHTPDEHYVQPLGRLLFIRSTGLTGLSRGGTAKSQTTLHTRHTFTRGVVPLALRKIRRHVGCGIFPSLLPLHVPPRKPMCVLPLNLSIWSKLKSVYSRRSIISKNNNLPYTLSLSDHHTRARINTIQ